MKAFARFLCVLSLAAFCVACGGGGGGGGAAVAPPPPPPPPSTGPAPFSLSRDGPTLYTIDRESGNSLGTVAISLPGEIIQGGRGLATSPVTEELFAVLSVDDVAGILNIRRLLTTIDPVSGIATKISESKVGRAGALAFDNSGTLYSGESANTGAGFENRLYVLDTVTGERTEFMPIANSEGGIALALNPLDGQIYHLSGSIVFDDNVGTPVFEKIDTTSMTRTAIPLSGVDMGHVRAMSFGPDGNFLVVATYEQFGPNQSSGRFFRLTPDGVATLLGSMNHISKGVAFVPPVLTVGVNGLAAACSGSNNCPDDAVTRAQMAMFLERGMRGNDFVPPPATGNTFLDVGASDFAASFIEQLFMDSITGSCGGNNYCPNDNVTRAQMAVFLLRAEHGAGYMPPAPTGIFGDVDLAYWAAGWIDQLAAEGITTGCGGGNYCPDNPVTRTQMAAFIERTFGR